MKNIEASGSFNFYYAAMEVVRNSYADDWVEAQYNNVYVPTCYFDGGDNMFIGGSLTQTDYTTRIVASGARPVPDLDLDISMVWLGNFEMEVTVTLTNNNFVNSVPDGPVAPSGPDAGLLEDEHMLSAVGIDEDGDQLYYMWDWGEAQSDWLGPYNSGEQIYLAHTWSTAGEYAVAVKVKDTYDAESAWSEAHTITVVARGDANNDGQVNVGDAVTMINYVFKGGDAPIPVSAGDANCDAQSNVGDAVFLINYVFKGGPAPGCP